MTLSKEKLLPLVEVEVIRHDEDSEPKDSFDFPEDIEHVRESLANGNEWAWCMVEVRVTFHGITKSDYLGACSYGSKKDFIDSSDYYSDMVNTCLGEIIDELNAIFKTLSE